MISNLGMFSGRDLIRLFVPLKGNILIELLIDIQVMKATYPPTGKAYAIKIIDKEPLARKNIYKIATVERNALLKLSGHPGIVQLHWAFQDEWSWC